MRTHSITLTSEEWAQVDVAIKQRLHYNEYPVETRHPIPSLLTAMEAIKQELQSDE